MTFLNYDPSDILNNNPAPVAYSLSTNTQSDTHIGGTQEVESQQDAKGGQQVNSSFGSIPSRSSTSTITWSVPRSTPGKFHPSKGDILLQHLLLLLFHLLCNLLPSLKANLDQKWLQFLRIRKRIKHRKHYSTLWRVLLQQL